MIKIQNIYYMLAYAFSILNEEGYRKIATEKFEFASDFLAAILAKGISNQIKRGLNREYLDKTESTSSPTGKINSSDSIKRQTMLKKQLVCSFDVFTEDTYMNQVLKTTAIILLRSVDVSLQQKRALKKVIFYFDDVKKIDPRRICWTGIKYNRNNATYKMLINICYLIIEGMLQTEKDGTIKLANYIDEQQMHRLYEKFVLEYYRRHYPQFNVSSAYINWNVDKGANEFLPIMKTDITLQYNGKTIIIDTKYYKHTMQTNKFFNSHTIHSNNLYQIFTYVKNKDVSNSGNVSGILLYAKTDEQIVPDNDYCIGGSNISVKTLDLNSDFIYITKQLDNLVEGLNS